MAAQDALPADRQGSLGVTDTSRTFTYRRPAGIADVTYLVEYSSDLVTWTTSGVIQQRVSAADSSGLETWQGSLAGPGPTVFFRLRVTQP